jgi:hypothetical protein
MCRPYINLAKELNINEKIVVSYNGNMNGHFEMVQYFERHYSYLINNIRKITQKKW